jgi:hypothetical protein
MASAVTPVKLAAESGPPSRSMSSVMEIAMNLM